MRYLIWDFDGTLAWRPGFFSGALWAVLEEAALDLPVTIEHLRPHLQSGFPWHTPDVPHPELCEPDRWWQALQPVFASAYRACGIEDNLAHELAGRVRACYCNVDAWQLYPDTIKTLATLKDLGWSHVVLSNHVPELRDLIAQLKLSPLLLNVFNSAETGYEKPHPVAFEQVLTSLGEHDTVWMIGDSYSADIMGAQAVGIPAILVRKPHPGAERSCHSLAEVIRMLETAE